MRYSEYKREKWIAKPPKKTQKFEKSLEPLKHSESSQPDFIDIHDISSEPYLFLAAKIRESIRTQPQCKKWSIQLQEELIRNITPQFQKKFPSFRLGVSAIKKTWETVNYYAEMVQSQKGALNQDGRINIYFLIKENMRSCLHLKYTCHLPPYHFAHQIASKMGECILAINGTKPKLDQLTRLIWSVHKQMIPFHRLQSTDCPYDQHDKLDRLVVKTILEIAAKEPNLSQKELALEVRLSFQVLQECFQLFSVGEIRSIVYALLAEKRALSSPFTPAERLAIARFAKRQIRFYKQSLPASNMEELVRRLLSLSLLASQMPKDLSAEAIEEAIDSHYPKEREKSKELPQSAIAFIAAETTMMKTEQLCLSPHFVKKALVEAYQEAALLPSAILEVKESLEILLWQIACEEEGILEKIPYKLGQRISEEIGNIVIENPQLRFIEIAQEAIDFFTKLKELPLHSPNQELEAKIQSWTIQSDMLLKWIYLRIDTPLCKLVLEKCSSAKEFSVNQCVHEISQGYLKQYPALTIYAPQLTHRIWTIVKYLWYTRFSSQEESSFDRFLKWHTQHILSTHPHQCLEKSLSTLEELCSKMVPLVPFDAKRAEELLLHSTRPSKMKGTLKI